jgi:hypothetical protein
MDAEFAARLNSLLRTLTMDELTFGHVTSANGQKHIQSEPAQRSLLFVTREADGVGIMQSISDLPKVDGMLPQVQLCGWREIGQLIQLAPATPETLSLLRAVLDAHERAVAPAIAAVLARFEEGAVTEWIEWLLAGRQARQVLAMEILWILARQAPAHWPLLATTLRRFTDDREAPDLVASKALRVLRDVFDAGLPAEITDLFRQPDVEKMQFLGQRDAWQTNTPVIVADVQKLAVKRRPRLLLPVSRSVQPSIITSSSVHVWRFVPGFPGLRRPLLRPQRLTRATSSVI